MDIALQEILSKPRSFQEDDGVRMRLAWLSSRWWDAPEAAILGWWTISGSEIRASHAWSGWDWSWAMVWATHFHGDVRTHVLLSNSYYQYLKPRSGRWWCSRCIREAWERYPFHHDLGYLIHCTWRWASWWSCSRFVHTDVCSGLFA